MLSTLGDVDYFMATWEKPCYTKVERYNDIHAIGGDTIYDDLLKPDDIITDNYLKSFLPFKKTIIMPMNIMDLLIESCQDLKWSIMSPTRLVAQYYMMNTCNAWRKSQEDKLGKKYDLIVRLRPDILIGKIPVISDLEKVYINNIVYKDTPADLSDMVNEMIYISNGSNMDKICKIYENFRSLWNINEGYGERISRNNLELMGLLDNCETFDFNLTVIRENGNDEVVA
jgi:hypothetical protein